ncbi:hypothetical protein JHK82_039307 [Glycine max]|nr:hypothetical protein JHK86_039484 [Glycine max]KAG4965087.1 hypothetical protein JHK85_040062 [Glycine max]KAG5110084.1 hypothetical protein JHK82_039307 [Glycine max]KAG5121369.1 hypothetical protein JHK84_039709 [Glycine max]
MVSCKDHMHILLVLNHMMSFFVIFIKGVFFARMVRMWCMTMDLKCDIEVRLWWTNDGPKSIAGYRAIKLDIDATELGKYFGAIGSQTTQGGGSDKGTTEVKVFENDGLVRSESDDSDEANDVYLDDSEDERDLGLDDDATLVY